MTSFSPRHFAPLFLWLLVGGCFNSGSSTDAGAVDGFVPDVPQAVDGGPLGLDAGPMDVGSPRGCGAEDARAVDCPRFVCDEPARWYWNGHSCFPIDCGACEGSACDSGPFDREECEAAHATCDPSLCRQSEGTWRFWGRADCGFVCGRPSGDDCANGPTCDCGARATFVEGRGCVEMDSCAPPPLDIPPQQVCEASGGEWGGFCAHSHCGQYSELECEADACHCPWPQVFDDDRGCVEAEACFRGDGGCDERSECGAGMACLDGNCEFADCPFDG